jgi:hypothetical protein
MRFCEAEEAQEQWIAGVPRNGKAALDNEPGGH